MKPADFYEEERVNEIAAYNIPIEIARILAAFEFENEITLSEAQIVLLCAKILDILLNPDSSSTFDLNV